MPEFDNPVLGLMYWFSNIFNIGINRKKFEMIVSANGFSALNNSRNSIFALFFYGVGSMLIVGSLLETRNMTEKIPVAGILVLIAHAIFSVLSFRQFLWLVNGRQEMLVQDGNLTLRKKGTFFTSDKMYPFKSIKNIRKAVDEDRLSEVEWVVRRISIAQKAFYRQIFGEVLFDYEYNTIRVFNQLDDQDKETLIAELLKWQEKFSSRQTPAGK